MKLRTLTKRSLRFHWRSHLGVVLGAVIGSAALIGALIVGDSVKGSLREAALNRVGWADAAMFTGDRLFQQSLGSRLLPIDQTVCFQQPFSHTTEALLLSGTVVKSDASARANRVNIFGV